MPRTQRAFLDGVAAGAIASLVMGVGMLAASRAGLLGRHTPPRRLTANLLRGTLGRRPPAPAERALATGAHLGYGSGVGAIYGLTRRVLPESVPDALVGAAFGALVYAASYGGWIPEAGLMPPPRRDVPLRQPTILALHLLYGAALALAWKRLEARPVTVSRAQRRLARERVERVIPEA